MTKIVVSSNCQTNGLVLALRTLLPTATVEPLVLPWPFVAEQHAELAVALKDADWWLTIAQPDAVAGVQALLGKSVLKVLHIPVIGFNAFHPDLCYVRNRETNELTKYHYNSALAAWAWSKGLSVDATARLFNRQVFQALGYFDAWQPALAFVRKAFSSVGLESDFASFFLHAQRSGNFMHSSNHPRIEVLVRLAKILALRMGADASVLGRPVEVYDELALSIWPLYPELASYYSVEGGSYCWQFSPSEIFNGLHEYLYFCFGGYAAQGLYPQQVQIVNRDLTLLDSVLDAHSRGCV